MCYRQRSGRDRTNTGGERKRSYFEKPADEVCTIAGNLKFYPLHQNIALRETFVAVFILPPEKTKICFSH